MIISIILIPVVLVAVHISSAPKTKKVLRPIKVRSTYKKF